MIRVNNSGISALILFVLAVTLLTACGPRMPPEYQWFFDLSPEQQHVEMKKFPIEKQVDYYLIGMSYVHPPRIGLADEIAQQGKRGLPYLVKRLQDEKEDYERANIILVLKEMSLFYYDLRGEKEVLRVLSETIATMKEPWKERGEDGLKAILERRMADPAKALQDIKDQLEKSKPTPSTPNNVPLKK